MSASATWSVPGRVNLIGEHLDYNGGPVLPFGIDLRTEVTVSRRADGRRVVTSDGLGIAEGTADITQQLTPGSGDGWARYVAAACWAHAEATGAALPGLTIQIRSTLPIGAGLSSSAALECGVVAALDELAATGLSAPEIARCALRAEREHVGVPCGPMDQLAVMLAAPEHAVLIDTRTLATEQVPLPLARHDHQLLVMDTRVRHAVADGAYADRRASCEAAATELGLTWLSDADSDDLTRITDPVVRRRARHVVSETARVWEAVRLVRADRPGELGPLLTASHRSLAEDFEVSSAELDLAVGAALEAGALGARMTGAGFGGSAIALCTTRAVEGVAERVRERFADAGLAEPGIYPVRPAGGARREVPRTIR